MTTTKKAVSGANLNRYEILMESFAGSTNGHSSCFAPASWQARSEALIKTERETEIVAVSTGVAGPVLCGYVLWTLQQAIDMGLQRIYFVSRDGEILLKITQRLLPAFWPGKNIELRYLLGSRQAWHLPSLAVAGQVTNDWLLYFLRNSTLKIIFSRVDLTFEDCQDRLSVHGFSAEDWDRKLVRAERSAVERLVQDPAIQERIVARARAAVAPVLGYLEQEGLMENVSYGLVDMGWTGRTKGSLERLLGLRGKAAPPFFFFGRNGERSQEDGAVLHTYLFNLTRGGNKERYMPAIEALMEVFCASLTEGLRAYQPQDDGNYGPVYRESNVRDVEAWGYQVMRDSILRFADKLTEGASQLKSPPMLPAEVSASLLKTFWLSPTKSEALVWGQFPFEEDQGGASSHRLVPPFKPGPRIMWRLFLNGSGFNQYAVWHGGIIATNSRFFGLCWRLIYRVRESLYALKLAWFRGERSR